MIFGIVGVVDEPIGAICLLKNRIVAGGAPTGVALTHNRAAAIEQGVSVAAKGGNRIEKVPASAAERDVRRPKEALVASNEFPSPFRRRVKDAFTTAPVLEILRPPHAHAPPGDASARLRFVLPPERNTMDTDYVPRPAYEFLPNRVFTAYSRD